MKVFIVYCHPSEDSFTRNVRDAFIKGIVDSGNEYVMSDLYKMNFKTDMSEKEYLRDSNYSTEPGLEKLVGWFDRVWSYGFAYGDKTMKVLDKALILCTAGKNLDDLENLGFLDCMKKVMLGDRLFNRVKESDFIVFDGMSKARDSRKTNWDKYLDIAYRKGYELFSFIPKLS